MEKADQMPRRYKILITGSGGMLGTDLCQELRRDYEVYGLDLVRRTAYSVQRFVRCDITDEKEIINAVSRIKPDVVVHAAAYTDVDGCELDRKKAYKINTEGTKNVALACKKTGAVLIYISTDFVFDGKKKRPYKEDDRTGPLSVYGDSKLKGEIAVRKILKKYFILRTSWLYGKHGKNFVDTILAKAKEGKALKVVDDQVGTPTYTKDLAKAIRVLLDKSLSYSVQRTAYSVGVTQYAVRSTQYGIYHVSNSGKVSWYEYAREILRLTGSRTEVFPISSEELSRPARRPAMSVLDNSKIARFTDYRMRRWQGAL
ncbi:MAG: dTDP-4-dehydrorhamnose reductase, partial [Candidatus Omnitrophica bacterium]|nr:dTDP-4-dehydrorhamnose reductase [Candidatus Omnitrophota bacterium]